MKPWLLFFLPVVLPAYGLRFHIGPAPTTVLELYAVLFVAGWLALRRKAGAYRAWQAMGGWRAPTLAWLAVTAGAAFWSPNVWSGFGLWRAYVLEPSLIFFALFDVVRDAADRRWLERGLWTLAVWVAGVAAIQFVTGFGIPHPWNVAVFSGRRATGPFPFPNAVSLLLAPLGAYAWSVWFARREHFALAAALAVALAIACARSVGGAMGYAAGLGLVFFVTQVRWRSTALVILLTFASLIWSIPKLERPVEKQLLFENWSGQVRLITWRETWRMLIDHPLTGAGFGGYPVVFKAYHQARAIEIFQFPHNILLNAWSEAGLPGVGVFAWIIVTWIRQGRRQGLMTLAPVLAILIHGLVDVPYFKNDLAIMFWLLIFLTAGVPGAENGTGFRRLDTDFGQSYRLASMLYV